MKLLVCPLVLALAALPACDSTKGDAKPSTTKADAKPSDAKPEVAKVADTKVADAKVAVADGKTAEVIDEAKNAVAEDTKVPPADAEAPNGYSAIPGPSGDDDDEPSIPDEDREAYEQLTKRPAAPAPATVAEASKQLEAWLTEPVKSPVPALLLATGDVELAVHCGPCDDHRLVDLYKTTTPAEFGLLASRVVYEGWSSGGDQKCDDRCCTFGPADNAGSGATNIEKICMAVGPDGKPTAYTRIDTAAQ